MFVKGAGFHIAKGSLVYGFSQIVKGSLLYGFF